MHEGGKGENMRVVQLGCGITGLVCAEHLARNSKVDDLILADAQTDMIEALARRIDSDKISVMKVDATDIGSVKELLKDRDLIVSSIPGELNKKVIRTAIATGIDYVDFSLPVSSEEEFEELLRLGQDSDITMLTAMGSDPGISDIFAMYAASKLDRADEVHVMDGDSATAEGYELFTLWSPLEMLEEATTPAAIYKDGEIIMVPPLSKKEIYEFPEPIGPLPVYNTLHEETYLIPRFIESIKYVDFKIAIDDDFARVANVLRKVGLHSLDPIDVKGAIVRPLDVVVALMPRTVDMIGKVKGHAAVVVEMLGDKDDKRTIVKIWTMMSHEKAYEMCNSTATGYLVGTGGAVGAEMIIAGEIKDKGLLLPEQVPAEKFKERISEKGLEVEEETHILN